MGPWRHWVVSGCENTDDGAKVKMGTEVSEWVKPSPGKGSG